MITVSAQAALIILESLKETGLSPTEGLRLTFEENRFSLNVDTVTHEDRTISHEGSVVLIIEPGVEEIIGEALIDVEEGPEGPRLLIKRAAQE